MALQLVAWVLLGNHSSTIVIACGYSKSTYYDYNRYSCLWNKHTVCVITVLLTRKFKGINLYQICNLDCLLMMVTLPC